MKTRRKTAKAALLCLFCALLMAALPVTALAATETYELTSEVSVSVDGKGVTFSDLGIHIQITVKGTEKDSVVTPGDATIALTNKTEKTGEISFK